MKNKKFTADQDFELHKEIMKYLQLKLSLGYKIQISKYSDALRIAINQASCTLVAALKIGISIPEGFEKKGYKVVTEEGERRLYILYRNVGGLLKTIYFMTLN